MAKQVDFEDLSNPKRVSLTLSCRPWTEEELKKILGKAERFAIVEQRAILTLWAESENEKEELKEKLGKKL